MPAYGSENARPAFDAMPWRDLREAGGDFTAWKTGRTGYPIVDAGMRQLWTTGWMHNRVRMIAASFLIKHLLIDWRHGARRSEEHTSELQSLMRISYAVFGLKKKQRYYNT